MTFEVAGADFGKIRMEQVRRALGDRLQTLASVRLLVLGTAGSVPALARIDLLDRRAGRGLHRVFACPACGHPKEVLHNDGQGHLACSGCARKRTRRQAERSRSDWRHLGGQEADALERILRRPGGHAAAELAQARRLAGDILRLDAQRAVAAQRMLLTLDQRLTRG